MPDKNLDVITKTEDWELKTFMDWVPIYRTETCSECKGKGKTGGGLGWLSDELDDCRECSGSGTQRKLKTEPRPPLPGKLIEHMRRAYWDFFNTTERS